MATINITLDIEEVAHLKELLNININDYNELLKTNSNEDDKKFFVKQICTAITILNKLNND